MILISGDEEEGFDVSVSMKADSDPFEVALDLHGEKKDISESKFQIKIDNKIFPMVVSDNIAKFSPSNIKMATGIYSFSVLMDGESIMNGYFEWLGDGK